MNIENYILDALEIVSAQIIPDEDFVQAVIDRARLAAMVNPDELWEDQPETH
jgi:hypothetical protein